LNGESGEDKVFVGKLGNTPAIKKVNGNCRLEKLETTYANWGEGKVT